MFLTSDTNKHPLSQLYGEGRHLWIGTEIHIRRIWFIVNFQLIQRDEDGEELIATNTVLLSEVEDVLNFAHKKSSLLSVYLMAPLTNSVDSGWAMDRLIEIWEAPDPGDPGTKAKIYVKESGAHHVDSLFVSTADQLDSWERLLELPAIERSTHRFPGKVDRAYSGTCAPKV